MSTFRPDEVAVESPRSEEAGLGAVLFRYRAGFFAAGIVIVLGIFYLLRSRVLFLPDGYIFLSYAENIAARFSWAINPPDVSFATSSPLWTVLCAICAALVQKAHLVLTVQVMGLLLFAGLMVALDDILMRFSVPANHRLLAVGAFSAIAFNGFYYAISAMETPLFMLLYVLLCRFAVDSTRSPNPVVVGVLVGLLFLTRVEGILAFPAFCAARLTQGASFRRLSGELVKAGLVFAVVIAPWQFVLFAKTGGLLPTSGAGRLYLYLPSVIATSMADYLASSHLARLAYIPRIIYGNFVAHPVVLAACLMPLIALAGVYLFALRLRISRDRLALIAFMAVFGTLNLMIYVLFQPLIFQRYLVVALPSLVVALALLPGGGNVVRPSRLTPVVGLIATACVLVATHSIGARYFDVPTGRDERVIGLFQKLDASTNGNCRLAAEPLGIAAFFTRCYIIDLGGLINPDIWPLFLRGTSPEGELDYARAHGASHIYWNERHPEIEKDADLAFGSSGPEVIYRLHQDRRP